MSSCRDQSSRLDHDDKHIASYYEVFILLNNYVEVLHLDVKKSSLAQGIHYSVGTRTTTVI